MIDAFSAIATFVIVTLPDLFAPVPFAVLTASGGGSLGLADELGLVDGELDDEGETDGDTEADGLTDADGEPDADGDCEGLPANCPLISVRPTRVGLPVESVKAAAAVLPVALNVWSHVEIPRPSVLSVQPAGAV